MRDLQFLVTNEPLEIDQIVQVVSAPKEPNGAVTSFVGLVRGTNQGKKVQRLEYEAYEPMALKAFALIASEARDRWPDVTVAVHHRVGRLRVGEASVAIAAASPHRAESFSACRYAIERIKQIAPIWKHEFFEGGDVWIEGAAVDPEDQVAREEAYRLACV